MQLIVRHAVRDYDTWRAAFDDDGEARGFAGLSLLQIWHDADDGGAVWLLYSVGDRGSAQAYLDGLAQVHDRQGGVTATESHFVRTA